MLLQYSNIYKIENNSNESFFCMFLVGSLKMDQTEL